MGLKYARDFRELVVYQKARLVAKSIFEATKRFPREENYSLIDQVRRSSRSIGAQITEAWAKRRYENHFISKLTDADAEQRETQHWLEVAEDCGYLQANELTQIIEHLHEIGSMLNSMIDKADRFCGKPASLLREETAEYFIR